MERLWKLTGFPRMDRYIGDADCLYSPTAEYVPLANDVPIVITMHDMHTLEPDLPWVNEPEQIWMRAKTKLWISRVFRKVSHVCTVSEFTKRRMVELLDIHPDKVTVVGCGVEQRYFDVASLPQSVIERAVEGPYVVVVGGLRVKKGGRHVLDVAKELLLRNNNLHIVVIGTNDPHLVREASIYSNVLLAGVVDDDMITQYVRGASSLLMLSSYEGFGIPLLEAMAAGVPTVAANRASLPEIGRTASIILEPDDAGAVVDALVALDTDNRLRDQQISRGQAVAHSFTWQQAAARVMEVLEKYS